MILITGVNGFIGTNLSIFLKRKNIKTKISIIDYIITIYFLFIRGYFYMRHKLYINFYKIFRKLKFFLE